MGFDLASVYGSSLLLHALAQGEYLLFYQPQFHLSTGEIHSVEALIRWQHPTRGLILPESFIPLAEEEGSIVEIGKWIIDTACRQNCLWQDHGLQPLRISVNVCTKQLQQDDFVYDIANILEKYHLQPQYLELELTENINLHQHKKIIQSIHALKKIGVKIALDDFGTGYSNISYLKIIPVDRIKIDKSYIEHVHTNKEDAAIVKALITLARTLNIQILAEGVESKKQLQLLMSQGCHEGQGYYFSEPLSEHEIEKFLFNRVKT
ncbi:MAG: hypothetical protein A3F12_07940 [Gammaproteobacteria bacterium RIFCSPHIGHO2_12_FULL_38_14]|nr:MAG: hypothetical protein A3F12_07940 [Gammaproteobacteria bacterium RIFCSPHIGHO2_12_FULL_38_14]